MSTTPDHHNSDIEEGEITIAEQLAAPKMDHTIKRKHRSLDTLFDDDEDKLPQNRPNTHLEVS